MKNLVFIGVINLLFLIAGLTFTREIVSKTDSYKQHMHEHVTTLDFKTRLFNQKEWLILLSKEAVDFIEDSEWNEKNILATEQLRLAKKDYDAALSLGYDVLYLCLILIFVTLLIYFKSSNLFLALSSTSISIALLLLYVGIYSPILEINAYSENLEIPLKIEFSDMAESVDNAVKAGGSMVKKLSSEFGYEINIPDMNYAKALIGDYKWDFTIVFEGRMYYFHQCKSIDTIIVMLFKDNNKLVAWAILIFSVLIPLSKLFMTALLIYMPKVRKVKAFMLFVKLIGKWSMADVFVAACFLAFLSFYNMNVGIETESNALIGIYFFFGYVVFSLLSSTLLWLQDIKEQKNKKAAA